MRDFTPEEVLSLVAKGPWAVASIPELARRIYDWAEGHPHLTQLLCYNLAPDATPQSVDACVETLRRQGSVRLTNIRTRLDRKPALRQYFDHILEGGRIAFYPNEIPQQRELELLGVIKGDPKFCKVRTGIYRKVFGAKSEYDVFLSYRRAGGKEFAERTKTRLEQDEWRVFLDTDNMGAGPFPDQLIRAIESTPRFVPILSVGSLEPGEAAVDWMRKEIAHALLSPDKRIVPMRMTGFRFSTPLTPDMEKLDLLQAADCGTVGTDNALNTLCKLLKEPLPG